MKKTRKQGLAALISTLRPGQSVWLAHAKPRHLMKDACLLKHTHPELMVKCATSYAIDTKGLTVQKLVKITRLPIREG